MQVENEPESNGGESAVHSTKSARTIVGRLWWLTKLCSKTIALLVTLYLLFVLIGMIPVNNDYQPADKGVDIWVMSNAVHADLVLPIRNSEMDWAEIFPLQDFSGDTSKSKYVLIGWGDRGFFIETQTWSQLKVSTAANALLIPSETCMHVVMSQFDGWDDYGTRVKISAEQYRKLVEFVRASFKHQNQDVHASPATFPANPETLCLIAGQSYGQYDAFYEAKGSYHCFNTCNSWIGRALQSAGVKVGWATPLPKTVYFYLPQVEKPVD